MIQANPQIRSLDAVILLTSNFNSQLEFYRDTLGLTPSALYSDAAFLKAGGQTLGIFGATHHPEAAQRLGGGTHGLSHLEFGISGSDFAAFQQRLDQAGARAYRDNFQDWDGNLFHFNLR